MKFLIAYVNFVERLTDRFGWLSQMIVPLTILIGFGNVVLRYFGEFVGIKLTNNAVIELQWYLYSLIFFFGFAYLLKHNINVRVDFWFANQPPRRKAWIDFIGHTLALLPFCLLALYVTFNPILTAWGHRSNEPWYAGWDNWNGTGTTIAEFRADCKTDPECAPNSWTSFQRIIDIMPWKNSPDPDGLPRAPIESMLLVGFGALLLQAIAEYVKLIAILRGSDVFNREESAAPLRIE